MRVKCVRFFDHAHEKETDSVGALTRGNVYHVLEIVASRLGKTFLRVVDDDGAPALYHIRCFSSLSEHLPSAWIAQIDESGTLYLSPEAWAIPGFWEDFLDGDKTAEAIYDREKQKILEEDPGREPGATG